MSTSVTTEQIEAVREIVQSAAKFRRAFSKGFTEGLLAEFYAAQHLHPVYAKATRQVTTR